MLKLHLFDLLWFCCTACCTTNSQQVEMSTTNPQHLTCQDVVDFLWTVQLIHNKLNQRSFSFDLLWTCCSVAANHRRVILRVTNDVTNVVNKRHVNV